MKEKDLLKLGNVIGFGKGTKESKGKDTGEPCVTVFVERKMKFEDLSIFDLIPKTVKGKKTDVVEVGEVKAQVLPDRKRYNPLVGGCEIGRRNNTSVGTLGMVFYKPRYMGLWLSPSWVKVLKNFAIEPDWVPVGLTNLHVVNDSVLTDPRGNLIVQEGVRGRTIGTVTHYDKIKKNKWNEIDAAIIELASEHEHSTVLGVGQVYDMADYILEKDDVVEKYGRTTRLKQGTVRNTGVTINVAYSDGNITFTDLIMTSKMSNPGDSGSIVVDDMGEVVGLLFAGSISNSFIIPFDKIRKRFNLHFWGETVGIQ